jgi:hypothetical protein
MLTIIDEKARGYTLGAADYLIKPINRGQLILEEGDVIEALGALEPVWDELYPAEQARIMRRRTERIDVAPDGISVTLHAAGIRSLVAELADQETPALAASEPLLEGAA